MSAAEFDQYTQGRTLFYNFQGRQYGVEKYLPDRRVIWSFLDGHCQEGHWYDQGGQICFLYDNNDTAQCWQFSRHSSGLIARFGNEPGATELYEVEDSGEEMVCLGPDVGV